jgi:hypothetical protein
MRVEPSVLSISVPPAREPKVQLCSLVSEASGESPIGSAWATERFLMMDVPLPWGYETLVSRHVPAGLKDLVYGFYARGFSWSPLAIAPNPAYSVEGMTRIREHTLMAEPLNAFAVRDFLVPTDNVVRFLALCAENQDAPELDAFQQPRFADARDMFVCTHGAIDACCAKFGYPVFKELSRLAEETSTPTRIWRCSHVGGHRFAPTVMEMPSGRSWGRLRGPQLGGIINHDVLSVSDMRRCYRGWAALPNVLQQVAEGEAFVRGGWEWTRCVVTPSAVPVDPEAIGGTITLDYVHPDGETGSITIDVIPDRVVETMGSSSSPELHDAQQYRCELVSVFPAGGLLDRMADAE